MHTELNHIQKEFENELFNSVIPFWVKHSVDYKHGGYYNCLSKEGGVYDTTKYMWLHGRQIWMFSKLYNTISPNKEWLKMASHGMDFMQKFAIQKNSRVYFSLNENGDPVYLQRKMFSECFYTIALAEYGRAIKSETLITASKQMFDKVWEFSRDTSLVGRPRFAGETAFQTLANPMILLNVIEEVYGNKFDSVLEKITDCIDKIKMHFVDEVLYENVLEQGGLHNSSAGRLINPGHAIEAGWFLKHWSILLKDRELNALASRIIRSSFDLGWDKKHGGIYYFLDSGGFSPTQLEWNMKLWWPHCEAMYAFLLLYSETREKKDWDTFLMIKNYTFSHFSDPHKGEWYGYLNCEGNVSQDFKGGPYKGCFHVPRALYLCLNLINKIND